MVEFLRMGGYAAYVWPAYGLTALAMAALVVASVRGLRARERLLAGLEAVRPGRPRRPTAPGEAEAAG
ncbi:MAG TPA: heme exporter protein CcmD [Azospirillaceae bacterium]|nr:heme exporter protein CcmD [Azospirillaceae bacterium]